MEKKIHEGRNVKRFREMLGIKQEALALQLGEDWSQRKISLLEQKENIDSPLLEQISAALKIPVEAIRHFDEEAAVVNIQNNYEGANQGSGSIANGFNHDSSINKECTFNPLEKYVEAVDKIEKLYAELLKAKEDQIRLLEKMNSK